MSVNALRRGAAAVLVGAALTACAAAAGVSDFFGNWFNSDTGHGGFLGSWLGSSSDNSGIARIVITQAGADHIRVHLYGLCQPAECDWGSQVGHNRSNAPDSSDVQSISADFDTGFATKHVTLRKGPGGVLRFDVVTDFTDHSGRHDYETSGSLAAAPASSTPVAGGVTPAPGTPGVTSAPATATTSAAEMTEDCVKINPEDVYVAPSDRGWKVNDFDHTILDFGDNKVAAVKASHVMEFYHFDEQCYVVRPHAKMIYWRTGGQFPRDPMPGQDCIDVHAADVKVAADGKVMDGTTVLLDYGDNNAAAEQAASVIRTYKFNRQCFVARPDTTMVYWLVR
jgi:hypothetical protein